MHAQLLASLRGEPRQREDLGEIEIVSPFALSTAKHMHYQYLNPEKCQKRPLNNGK